MKENSIKKEQSSIEENIEILEKFKNNEMQRDKLERDGRCGGWKIGDIYKCLELDNAIGNILSDYKRVLKENEKKNKIIDLMENYMVENGWEICFDNIYAELNNCNGMERDWCRDDKLEKQDIHKYFSKKLLESEE